MKLGTLTVALGDLPFEEACRFLAERGVQMVEIGCGGFPGKAHCDAAELLADEGKRERFMETLDKYHLEISALSSHGNMVHPDRAVAERFEKDFTNAILLAEKLKVPVVNTFSGCPAAARRIRPPTGLPAPGRMILPRFWSISGMRYWFLIGRRRRLLHGLTASLRLRWNCIPASVYTIRRLCCGSGGK